MGWRIARTLLRVDDVPIEPWLPRGFSPAADIVLRRCVSGGDEWQIYDTENDGRILVAQDPLFRRWHEDGLVSGGEVVEFSFGSTNYAFVEGGRGYRLECVEDSEPPSGFSDCEAFVASVAATRSLRPDAALNDAVYVERLSRLLPSYALAPKVDDAHLVGYWITGGVNVSLLSTRRVRALAPWLTSGQLGRLAQTIGLASVDAGDPESTPDGEATSRASRTSDACAEQVTLPDFALPGRPLLETFFNEHVIDLIRNEARYRALGIGFPGAILLHGPPGCGKTFAVERLVDHLDWPFFSVDSGSIGSPYIHETGRKIAEIFDQAAKVAPAVVVIDELDAFLSARDSGSGGQHRVEEVAEFLRSIPRATENRVLVIGMTNRLDSLDPAVVRRGRFDHILSVDMPSEADVKALLESRFREIPADEDVDVGSVSRVLAGRPLSDVGFIVREACRIAAKSGASRVAAEHLNAAIVAAPARGAGEGKTRRIGFL